MAEFSELVRIKKRICAKYKKDNCVGCPISDDLCGIISISGYSDLEFKRLEDVIAQWAAENPEPVYPSWGEWLTEMYYPGWQDEYWMSIAEQPIPNDIAQKLGIEPKEG